MEFRIVASSPHAAVAGKATFSAERALEILRANPAVEVQDIETGKRYGLADLERLIGEPRDA
jgi:hypothetical protein